MENIEEARKALETARWKTEALYNLHSPHMMPDQTNGPMLMCGGVLSEIDRAITLLSHIAKAK